MELYVGNLSWSTTDASLGQAFAAFGEVSSAVVKKDGDRSRGFGFVTMATEEAAQAAIAAAEAGLEIDGRAVRVNAAGDKPAGGPRGDAGAANPKKLYVGNLPWSIDEQGLMEMFSQYGVVEKVDMPRNERGQSRGLGFVEFAEADAASAAADALNGQDLEGRALTVNIAKPMSRGPRRDFGGGDRPRGFGGDRPRGGYNDGGDRPRYRNDY
jgi:nucleolin